MRSQDRALHYSASRGKTKLILTILYNICVSTLKEFHNEFIYGEANDFYRAMLRRAQLCHSKSSVRLSVRLSVTLTYVFHTGWNTSNILSRPKSLRYLLTLTPKLAIWCNGNTPKLRWNRGVVISRKTCNIFETVQDRTNVTMTD